MSRLKGNCEGTGKGLKSPRSRQAVDAPSKPAELIASESSKSENGYNTTTTVVEGLGQTFLQFLQEKSALEPLQASSSGCSRGGFMRQEFFVKSLEKSKKVMGVNADRQRGQAPKGKFETVGFMRCNKQKELTFSDGVGGLGGEIGRAHV